MTHARRIVFLNPIGGLGGAERSLLDLLASLRKFSPDIDCRLLAGTQGPLLEHAARLGASVELLPMPAALTHLGNGGLTCAAVLRGWTIADSAFGYAAALGRRIRALRPDVVHSNGLKFHLFTKLADLREVPVVWHIRDYLARRPRIGFMLRHASTRMNAAIAVSQSVADDARSFLAPRHVHVVLNAVDTDAFSPGAADGELLDFAAGMAPAPTATFRVGLPAAYATWKGFDVFLRAAARLNSESVRFYVIGGPIYHTDGSQHTEVGLRRLANELGLSDRVGFVAFQSEMPPVLRALDVVVHASIRPEPFGRVIAEAMSCGRAVISSNAGGAAELFTHNHDALAVPPGDEFALAGAMNRLLIDRQLRLRLGEEARRTAVTRFSRDRLGREVVAVYRTLTGNSRRRWRG